MQVVKLFLYYYAIIVTTVLSVAPLFLLPKPQNIATSISLIPVAILLWSYIKKPESISAPKWSTRLVIVILVLSFLGITTYFTFARHFAAAPASDSALSEIKQSFSQSNTDEQDFRNRIESQLSALGAKLDSLGSRDLSVLGVTAPTPSPTPEPAALGQITAKDPNLTTITVYDTASKDASIVGSAQYGIKYPFFEKTNDWYKISLGWVEAKWFTEVSP